MKDYKLYNSKDNTRIIVDFVKDQAYITCKIVSHKDGLYQVKCTSGYELSLLDEQVDHVDPVEDSDQDIYEIYLTIDMSHTIASWYKELRLAPEDKSVLNVSKVDYDISTITDKLLAHAKDGLKNFYEKGDLSTPYYPIAYIIVMDIMNDMFGGFWTTLIGSSPMAEFMVLCWLHGYLTSSAIRKQGIRSKVRTESVSAEEIEEKRKEQEEMITKVMDHLRKHMENQEGDFDDPGKE